MIANTWVAVHRGDDANVYGDEVDLNEPVTGLEHVAMAITEQSRTVTDAESDEVRSIRYAIGRARPGLDIRSDDRLHDTRQDRWWLVRSISGGGFTFYGAQDLSLDLRAV